MPAFASIESSKTPLGRPSAAVGVFRYAPDAAGYQYLPNIRILTIRYREGADAGVARFRYVFNTNGSDDVPSSFTQVMSVDASSPGVVANDDRLVVLAENPDGSPQILFDGFAQVPELGLAPDRELVTFLAFGVAIREWDTPISGALVRDADNPTTVSDQDTDLVTHFNPQGLPNATPEGSDATTPSGETFPTFLDPHLARSPAPQRFWTLPMAVRYLCFRHNQDQTYVRNPDESLIDAILDSRSPLGSSLGGFLPGEPGQFQSNELIVPDYPASGKVWPLAIRDLLAPNGFGMAFRIDTDDSGNPVTALDIFRLQDGSSANLKDLYLQPRGATLDPGQTNLGSADLARDMSGVANAVTVESGLIRYEASFILAPGFPIASGDASGSSSLSGFDSSNPNFSQISHDAYRLYVLDETGEGHWDRPSSSLLKTVPSLDALFDDGDASKKSYVARRRIPVGMLFSVDASQKPLGARLSISTDYTGTQPGLWDGTGTWQPVGGGFELLRDRLGVWINAPNPNSWNIQPSKVSGAPYPAGVVKGVEDQANTNAKHFTLRLTCVVEGDHVLSATADRRPSSPTNYAITRRVDARDRFAKQVIAANSEFNPTSKANVVRDDGAEALAEANARRNANEAGEVAGSVVIPRFTQTYRIGDRVRSIQGRNLSLQTNAGSPTEEGEVFPAVVGVTWDFEGDQRTVLQLSDLRNRS